MPGEISPTDYIELDGTRLRFRLEGAAGAPVVVFGNSLATSLEMWDPQVPALASRYRLLRFDTRGHGRSAAPPPPYAMDRLAADVTGLMDRLAIARAVYVGLSLGGMVGQYLGATRPERFTGLVLAATALRMDRKLWDDRVATVLRDGVAPQVAPSLERWFTPAFRAAHPEQMTRIQAMIGQTAREGYAGCAAAIRDMALEQLTPTIRLPTLVLVGDEDPSTPPAQAEAIRAAIPGARLAVIEGARHLPNIEQPKAFNELLGEFLARHAAL